MDLPIPPATNKKTLYECKSIIGIPIGPSILIFNIVWGRKPIGNSLPLYSFSHFAATISRKLSVQSPTTLIWNWVILSCGADDIENGCYEININIIEQYVSIVNVD